MNSKKKNKNKQSKPSNANPSQKVESVNEPVEKVEHEKDEPKIEPEIEEKVAEVLSEVNVPTSEIQALEDDTPKKPKRNRGKKKKPDQQGVGKEEKPPETVEVVKETIEVKSDIKAEHLEAESQQTAPSAPNKKNKNKKNVASVEEEPKMDSQTLKVVSLNKEESEKMMSDVKIVTLIPVNEATETETKNAKKKNKKKKRNDSERSDKEELVSCTSAFEKLMVAKEDNKDNMKGNELIELNGHEKDKESINICNVKLEETLQKQVGKEDIEQDMIKPLKEESGKNKIKNNKANKQVMKSEDQSVIETQNYLKNRGTIVEQCERNLTELSTKTEDEGTVEKILEPTTTTTTEKDSDKKIVQKETSPKPKPKFAKPVDKKRKDKTDSTENILKSLPTDECIGIEDQKHLKITTESDTTDTCSNIPKEGIEISESSAVTPNSPNTKKNLELASEYIEERNYINQEVIGNTNSQAAVDINACAVGKMSGDLVSEPQLAGTGKIDKNHDKVHDLPEPKCYSELTKTKKEANKPKSCKSSDARKKDKKSPNIPKNLETTDKEQCTQDELPINEQNLLKPLEFQEFLIQKETQKVKIHDTTVSQLTLVTGIEENEGKSLIITEKNHDLLNKDFTKSVAENVAIPLGFREECDVKGTPKISSNPPVVVPVQTQQLAPEGKKRRKKSPQPPKHENIDGNKSRKDISKKFEAFTEKPGDTTKEGNKELKDTLPDLPLEDIEIRSIQAEESEGSPSDIVPDVHYPRSRSQLVDDNNNTVIREIPIREDCKLNLNKESPIIPFVQDSGETPVSTPEVTPSDKTSERMKSKLSEEKTDLKSKVLEVNQDMEELRLSIERSLAELTAIERSEEDTAKQFQKAHDKLEEIRDIASKQLSTENRKDTQGIGEVKSELSKNEAVSIPNVNIDEQQQSETLRAVVNITPEPPVAPFRKDNKGKSKSKKKGKQEEEMKQLSSFAKTTTKTDNTSTGNESVDVKKAESSDVKKEETSDQKTESSPQTGKQQSDTHEEDKTATEILESPNTTTAPGENFEPIENFEDALTSSVDDVNKTFEIIATEFANNPEINITAPVDDDEKVDRNEKINPVSQPKNLLGHPDLPVRLSKTDYKKEKNKSPNMKQAKVKIKDSVSVEMTKQSKESQTESRKFLKDKIVKESISSIYNGNEEYVYKYSFRKVFLPNVCHVCRKDLKITRIPCRFCNLVFYCSQKHKDEDYPQHQGLCFAVSTIVHLKSQKHIYADAKNITGHNYRLLRMQMIVSCEKVLKRRLVPFEQEALLYPRICADETCREWRQEKLKDCEACGQIAYCIEFQDHLPKTHQRWCKSYSLYQRLVCYQQTKGRLELKLPSKVMTEPYLIPDKMNEVLAAMYEEKIDMKDIQYAALTQVATAPLTAAYCQHLFHNKMNAIYANGTNKKVSFTIHVVGAELQFEADALNKWEVFFLHLRPDVKDLRIVLIGPDLNPSKLPLDLLGKIKLCENCIQNKRRVMFDFQDGKTYQDYWATEFIAPDLVCAFNANIKRASSYNGKDTWPATIKCILKQKVPFVITSHTLSELQRDLAMIKQNFNCNVISEAKLNNFASLRPDRNFISDEEMPLLFKNYCCSVVCGAF